MLNDEQQTNCSTHQLLNFYYQLIFVNVTLSSKTYLPAPLQYAWKLATLVRNFCLKGKDVNALAGFRQQIQRGHLNYI